MARIVLLEADTEVRSLLQDALERHGYQVHYRRNAEGLRLVAGTDPVSAVALAIDGEMECHRPPRHAAAGDRRAFLDGLLRALSIWHS